MKIHRLKKNTNQFRTDVWCVEQLCILPRTMSSAAPKNLHSHNMGVQYGFSVFHQDPLKLSLISILIVAATVYDTVI